MGKLDSKIAIVTGGGQGIGKGISLRLAQEGATVVIASRHIDKHSSTIEQLRKESPESFGCTVDVSKIDSVDSLISTVYQKFGKIDILVNNAGFYASADSIDSSMDEWNAILGTNLFGAIYATRAVAKVMRDQHIHGAVVNISSIQSVKADPGSTAYCLAKGGIDQLTRAMAVDLAPLGIRVNAVAPGFIDTPLWGDKDSEENYLYSPDFTRNYLEEGRIPLRRIGNPTDIGNVVAFLAGDESSYITGQIIIVDGGLTITF